MLESLLCTIAAGGCALAASFIHNRTHQLVVVVVAVLFWFAVWCALIEPMYMLFALFAGWLALVVTLVSLFMWMVKGLASSETTKRFLPPGWRTHETFKKTMVYTFGTMFISLGAFVITTAILFNLTTVQEATGVFAGIIVGGIAMAIGNVLRTRNVTYPALKEERQQQACHIALPPFAPYRPISPPLTQEDIDSGNHPQS